MSSSITNTRTVILFGREDLLARSIEIFLSKKKDWEVIRFSIETESDVLIREITKAKPNVVVLCQKNSFYQEDLLLQLMQINTELKVITVSSENNAMRIYNKKNVLIQEVTDLLNAIDSF